MFRLKAAFFFLLASCTGFMIFAQSPSSANDINLVSANFYSNSPLGRTFWNVAFKNQLTPLEQKKLFYFEEWENKGSD